MSIKVESQRLGDMIIRELPDWRSRLTFAVPASNAMAPGQVVCDEPIAKKKQLVTYLTDEIHTVTITGTGTTGSVTFVVWHSDGYWVETAAIPVATISAAIVLAAINTALGMTTGTGASASSMTGSAPAPSAFTITWGGSNYTHKVVPLGHVNWQNWVGVTAVAVTRSTSAGYVNETQTVTFDAAITAGFLAATVYTPDGTPLVVKAAFSSNVAGTVTNWNTAMTAAATAWYGAASVGAVMTRTSDTVLVLTYSGNGFAGYPCQLADFDISGATSTGSASIVRNSLWPNAIALATVAATATSDVPFVVKDAIVNGKLLVWGGCDPTFGARCLEKVGITVRNEPLNKTRL